MRVKATTRHGSLLQVFSNTIIHHYLKYDDSLDVVGVHGVGGALGALLVGVFAIRPVMGGMPQLMLQVQGLLATGIYAFVCTLILGVIIHKTIGFTVDPQVEDQGLDIEEHGESAYRLT